MGDRPVRAGVAEGSTADLGDGQFGVSGHVADVALHGDREADTDGMPIDRGDHRLAELPMRVDRSGDAEKPSDT